MARLSQLPQDLPILNAQLAQLASLKTQVAELQQAQLVSGYTPTLAAASGAFTTAQARGRFTQIADSLIFVEIEVKITTHGTGAFIIVGLPKQSAQGFSQLLAGREAAIGGKMLQTIIAANKTTATVLNYDNSDPVTDGGVYVISGVYEIAT